MSYLLLSCPRGHPGTFVKSLGDYWTCHCEYMTLDVIPSAEQGIWGQKIQARIEELERSMWDAQRLEIGKLELEHEAEIRWMRKRLQEVDPEWRDTEW